jgi:hypothetical protein
LLVVITIIALLIALLMPSLSKAIDASRQVVCASQQRQLAVAMVAYATESRGRLLASLDESQSDIIAQAWARKPVLHLLDTYLGGNVRLFFCPGFMANNTAYYTEPEKFFEFSTSWRNWYPRERITSYVCGSSIVLDPKTTTFGGITYPLGSQRVTMLNDAKPDDMLFADLMMDVTNDFYFGQFVGFSSPSHPAGLGGAPRGGNVIGVDGAATWKSFDEMMLRYSYNAALPSGIRQYWW